MTAPADALAALWATAQKTRTIDFQSFLAVLADNESPLARLLAQMAAQDYTFVHHYQRGKMNTDDRRFVEDFRAQLTESGITTFQEPDGKLRQNAQDLLPWALEVALEFCGNKLSAFDLVQHAALGLTEGLAAKLPERDFARGIRLWCEYRICCALANEPDWEIYPAAELALVDAWLRAQNELLHEGVSHPTDEQCASKMGKSESEAAQARALVAAQAKTGRPFKLSDA